MTKKLKIEIKKGDYEGKYMYMRLGFDTQILDENTPLEKKNKILALREELGGILPKESTCCDRCTRVLNLNEICSYGQ